jgi:cytochrome c peroxidase
MLRRIEFSEAEARGLAVFTSPVKGNCASCHPTGMGEGLPPLTDFGYVAVGVPRNMAIAANSDPRYYDLGLCGPLRTDLAGRNEFCGMFRAPSLRNTARRRSYFHNGEFHDLRKVLEFYATRDTQPEKWYPRGADGTVVQFDDMPPDLRGNVNREPPFGGKPGDKPQMSQADIDDLFAFLQTLNDGYSPPKK